MADTPAPQFDRPGIAFATATVPRGSLSFEQGLPDFQHSSDAGVKATTYAADTNVRIGLTDSLELQVGGALFNYMTVHSQGTEAISHGMGDSNLALKISLPSASPRITWAMLGGVTFATGDRDFTAGAPEYDLGTTVSVQLADNESTAFYVNVSRFHDATTYTVSPSFSYSLTDTVGTFFEAGASHASHEPDIDVAGGGVTWMVTPVVQLDLSADFGLNHASPDIHGGFGFSVFVD
jgi:hypothetical protein